MRERENWDVLCEECDKVIIIGVKRNPGIIIVKHVMTS